MTDLLGPADAGATPTLTTTTDVTDPVAGDTWFNDCPAGVVDASATPIVSKWLNWTMQQLRVAIRKSNVPIANSYDNMLSWAIQSGYANWAGNAGGTANALTGTVDNAPIAITTGTVIRGIATATNTGAATFNLNGLGDANVRDLDGHLLTGGELVDGRAFELMRVGSYWVLLSPMPLSWLIPHLPDQNPITRTDVGAALFAIVFGAGDIDIHDMVGAQGSWSYDSVVNYYSMQPGDGGDYTGSGNYYGFVSARDIRWPSSAPPGVWRISQIWIAGTGYNSLTSGAGTHVILRRIS